MAITAARRCDVTIKLNGIKAPDKIKDHILSVTYTDSKEKYSDDLQITIDNRDHNWLGDWIQLPAKGAKPETLRAIITQKNWDNTDKTEKLDCGIFDVDDVELSGPPDVITIKAAAVTYSTPKSQKKRTRAFRNTTMKSMAAKIAKEDGCTLMYSTTKNPFFKRKEQIKKTNVNFLAAVCKSQGLTVKRAAKLIVIFDAAEFGKLKPIKTIKRGDKNILSYRFKSSLCETVYTKATVSYKNPKGKGYKKYTYTKSGATSGKTLTIKKKVKTLKEAKALAKSEVAKANAQQFTATITMMGNVKLVAGNTVTVSGFEKFDKKYMIVKATHKVTGGYTTTLELEQAQ